MTTKVKPAKKAATRDLGRPSKYSKGVAAEITDRVSNGESLLEICKSKHLPARSTVMQWIKDHEDFRTSIAYARDEGQHVEMEKCIELADAATPENWQVKKLQIWARQWRASKLLPKRYGDKLDVEASHEGQIHIVIGGNVDPEPYDEGDN